jgi:hypothetical protein
MFPGARRAGELSMFFSGNYVAGTRSVVLATLLSYSCFALAQRGAGGGYVGGGTAGGGGLSSTGHPSGIDVKDDLKDFHAALAVQASSQQIVAYELMMKSTEAASAELGAFTEQLNSGAEASGRRAQVDEAIEKARAENKKFLEGFSDKQKAGLKEIEKRLAKADSDLGQQIKELDEKAGDARAGGQAMVGSAQGVGHALTIFQGEQIDLGEEMSISEGGELVAFQLGPSRSAVRVGDQTIGINTTGSIAKGVASGGQTTFKVELTADLADLQQDLSDLLRDQLDRSERCGMHVAIQSATLSSSEPASVAAVQLHFERWSCFGGVVSEMAEGNGTIEVTLNLAAEKDGELRVEPKIARIEAEGLVGDLLRSSALGDSLRDKLAAVVLATAREGTNFKRILPQAALSNVAVDEVEFQGTGTGKLMIVLHGEIRVSNEKAASLIGELKQRSSQGTAVESVSR